MESTLTFLQTKQEEGGEEEEQTLSPLGRLSARLRNRFQKYRITSRVYFLLLGPFTRVHVYKYPQARARALLTIRRKTEYKDARVINVSSIERFRVPRSYFATRIQIEVERCKEKGIRDNKTKEERVGKRGKVTFVRRH